MLTKLISLLPDANILVSLPTEELAVPVLKVLLDPKNEQYLSHTNFHIGNIVEDYSRSDRPRIMEALAQVWLFLIDRGYLVPKQYQKDWYITTEKSRQYVNQEKKNQELPTSIPDYLLHPLVRQQALTTYMSGQYGDAVFQAFRAVEVHVRTKGGYTAQDLGAPLMRKAFDEATGNLTEANLPAAEKQAMAHLFSGAIGAYKNPGSHHIVIRSRDEAARLLVFASLLLFVVDAHP